MFHHSTTLHHSHRQFSGFTGRENRVVYEMGRLAKWKLKSAVAWDYMRPVRKLGRLYSWSFGWPLITKGADMTMKGGQKVVDGAEWSGYAAKEAAAGAAQSTLAPLAMGIKSRLVAIKRLALWDVPLATLGAAVRTPLAILKSPLDIWRGCKDLVKNTRENIGGLFNAVRGLDLGKMANYTRRAITDVLLPAPITKPIKSILEPTAHLISTAIGAEWQTVSTARTAITEVIPNGVRRMWNAPATASAIMAEKQARREADKAKLEQEREERRAALDAQVADAKGEAVPGGDKKKTA